MDKYIKQEAAIAIIEEKQKELCPLGRYGRGYVYGSDREKYDAWDEIIDALENIPAADVAPVVHGRWVSVAGKRDRICLRCLHDEPYKNADDDAEAFEFCPHCGAKMEGGDRNAKSV